MFDRIFDINTIIISIKEVVRNPNRLRTLIFPSRFVFHCFPRLAGASLSAFHFCLSLFVFFFDEADFFDGDVLGFFCLLLALDGFFLFELGEYFLVWVDVEFDLLLIDDNLVYIVFYEFVFVVDY